MSIPDLEGLLRRCRFPSTGTDVVCGVSGGADSLALLVLAVEAGLSVTAVHVDHGIRDSSKGEAEFVSEVAATFGADFRSVEVDVAAGSDLEQRARVARHAALGPEALLGHTADDQAETLLINLIRGTGMYGLAGIEPNRQHPILALRRYETHQICDAVGLVPFHDPSNDDPRFVRNRVRSELLPLIADISERDPVPLLVRTAELSRSTGEDLDLLAAELDPTDTKALRAVPGSVAVAALRTWLRDGLGHPPSAAELTRVLAVVQHDVIACELSGGRRIARTEGILRIEPSDR